MIGVGNTALNFQRLKIRRIHLVHIAWRLQPDIGLVQEQQPLIQPLLFWPSGCKQLADVVIGSRPSRSIALIASAFANARRWE